MIKERVLAPPVFPADKCFKGRGMLQPLASTGECSECEPNQVVPLIGVGPSPVPTGPCPQFPLYLKTSAAELSRCSCLTLQDVWACFQKTIELLALLKEVCSFSQSLTVLVAKLAAAESLDILDTHKWSSCVF